MRCRSCQREDSVTVPVIRATGICVACKPAESRQTTADDAEDDSRQHWDTAHHLAEAVGIAAKRAASRARLEIALARLW